MAGRFEGKVCIITAAGGGGAGRASALRFAAEGATVVVNDRDGDGAAETVDLIEAAGGSAAAWPGDIGDSDFVTDMVDTTVKNLGRLDVLFNHAGGGPAKKLHELSADEYRQTMAVTFDATYFGTHAALPTMMSQGSGVILSTSSSAGLNAVADFPVYGAAKAAVIMLMRNVAIEYGKYGIRANTIAPGFMGSPGVEQFLDTLPGGRAEVTARIPVGRLGNPDDIASAAVFLASDEATYINGVVLPVDGGTTSQFASPRGW